MVIILCVKQNILMLMKPPLSAGLEFIDIIFRK